MPFLVDIFAFVIAIHILAKNVFSVPLVTPSSFLVNLFSAELDKGMNGVLQSAIFSEFFVFRVNESTIELARSVDNGQE